MNPEIITTTTEEYKELIESLKKDGFEMMVDLTVVCLLYTSPSPRDVEESRMPSSA